MNGKAFFDGTEVSYPDGVKSLSQELFYDDNFKGIFYRVDNDLTFSGDGYNYIENIVFNQGICAYIELVLLAGSDVMTEIFTGIIHVVDAELNVSRETVKTPVADNNASSFVFNNKSVKAFINAAKSKSGSTITAAANTTSFDLFIPSTGVYSVSRDNIFTVDEAFRFMADFVSDGQMTYSSPFFGAGGAQEGLVIANATHLADGSDLNPYLSFDELYTEMNKLFDLSFYIDFSGALPNFVIDLTDNLYTTTPLMTFSDVKDVIVSFDTDRFYSSVNIGSSTTTDYQGGTFTVPDANFLAFREEQYYIIGQCNVDRTLDLVNKFIIDSNTIEDLIVNGNTDYENQTVIIESDLPGTGQATKFDNLLPSGFMYNRDLNNFNKALNYLGAIPNDMVKFITNDANNFEASTTAYSIPTGIIIHDTEITDPGGNYDPVLGRFTCPGGGDGSWSFTFSYVGLSFSGTLGFPAGSIKLRHYDSGAVLIEEQTIVNFPSSYIVIIDFGGGTGAFNLAATDYVEVWGTAGVGANAAFSETFFKGNFIDVEGGTYQTSDPNTYKAFKVDFEAFTTLTEFENIRDNVTDQITVQTGPDNYKGWVRNLSRNPLTGKTKITLRTSNLDI